MLRVSIVSWNLPDSLAFLAAHFTVETCESFGPAALRASRENPPDVFVVDLSRRPSHGREVAGALRQSPKTRHVPLVFYGCDPVKLPPIQTVFPDSPFVSADDQALLIKTVRSARPLAAPVIPKAMMDRYAGRTAAQKLGLSATATVTLIDPPAGIERILGDKAAYVERDGTVTLCFAHSADGLRSGLSSLRDCASKSKCWLLWRKNPRLVITASPNRSSAKSASP